MPELDEFLDGNQLYFHLKRIAQRAIGVGKTEEQIFVFIVFGGDDDRAVRQEDVYFQDRFVHKAISERGGLDTHSSQGSADGDRLELGNDGRHQLERQRVTNQVLVRRHTFDFGNTLVRINANHLIEMAQIQLMPRLWDSLPEQIGGRLFEGEDPV